MALDIGSTHASARVGCASSNLDPIHPEVPLEGTLRTLKGMETGPTINTERLVLRRWSIDDRAELAALNADPEVMEHFPGVLSAEESYQMLQRIELHFEEFGFGLWAVNTIWMPRLIGFCGLAVPTFRTHFTPAVEIGWRFARDEWGNGYAIEAGRAALDYGFEQAGLEEILSWTIPANQRSQGVMMRVGMERAPELDFDHPRFVHDDRFRRHVVYRMTREDWSRSARADPVE
jgi:ribosomal-protein-alanine N-acetyltransferase